MKKSQGVRVVLLGCFAMAAVPASAGGLLGGTVGGVAGSVTSSVGGAAGLGASGAPLGGLGGGLTGGANGRGNGLLGATISSNGVPPGTGSGLTRPLHGATDKLRGATHRPWGTFEDAKGKAKSMTTSVTDQAVGFTPKGTLTSRGPLSADASPNSRAQGSAKAAGGLRRSLDGMVLSRSVMLPEASANGSKASAKGQARASGSAETRRAKVASSGGGSVDVQAPR